MTAPGPTAASELEPDERADDSEAGERAGGPRSLVTGLRRIPLVAGTWVLILDLILIAVFTAVSQHHVFWGGQDFRSLMLNGTDGLLLALGMAMLLGARIVDLSVGANLVLSSVVSAEVITHTAGTANAAGDYPHATIALILALVACIAAGMVFGLVNGLVIAYLDVNPVIATLGTLGVGTGIALLITKGSDIGGLPSNVQSDFGLATFAGIPLPALVALVIAVALWAVLRYTRYGLRTLATGSSRLAADRAGLRVRPQLVSLTIFAGALAGLAGFVSLSQFGATTVSGHDLDALAALTAVVIGGTLLEGGRISIPGAVWGTGLTVILQGGLVVVGVQSFWQQITVGAVLIAAVAIDRLRYRRQAPAN